MTTWADDFLEYGYVVEHPPTGGWWHIHFARAAFIYHCELLGRSTNVVACVQHFARGCVRQSAQYLLTLDGEGIEYPTDQIRLDFSWGQDTKNANLIAEAQRFQREVMPLIYECGAMQQAVAEIVRHHHHLRLVSPGKLQGL